MADTEKPYGDVKYADPGYKDGTKRYPIDTKAHAKAAWSYVNMPKNQAGYTAEQLSAIKGRIKAALKRFGVEVSEDQGSSKGNRNMTEDATNSDVERMFTTSWQPKTGIPVELRNSAGSHSRSIGGYAALFNRDSEYLGSYVERIAPPFFNNPRADGWPGVICRYNHDDAYLLGSTRGNTLHLTVDETGLDYVVEVPEHRSDVLELVTRGDVANSSFAFIATEVAWDYRNGSVPVRTLVSGKLIDVGPVTVPAYRDTTAGLRSLARFLDIPEQDVRDLNERHELRKLFARTDGQPPRKLLSGREAKLRLLAKQPQPI